MILQNHPTSRCDVKATTSSNIGPPHVCIRECYGSTGYKHVQKQHFASPCCYCHLLPTLQQSRPFATNTPAMKQKTAGSPLRPRPRPSEKLGRDRHGRGSWKALRRLRDSGAIAGKAPRKTWNGHWGGVYGSTGCFFDRGHLGGWS